MGFGSTPGHNFYLIMQYGSKLEIPGQGLTHASEIKNLSLLRGAMHLQSLRLQCTRYVSGRGSAHVRT